MDDQSTIDQSTPPVEVVGYDEAGLLPKTRWPKVIGTISISFGVLGVACNGCGFIGSVLSPLMAGMAPPNVDVPQPGGVQSIVQIAQTCVASGISLWLLLAGVGMTRRRRWSGSSHVAWAFVKIVFSLLATVLAMVYAEDSARQFNDQLSQGGQQTPPFVITAAQLQIAYVIGLIWFLVFPVFLILWFSRESIKKEISTWP